MNAQNKFHLYDGEDKALNQNSIVVTNYNITISGKCFFCCTDGLKRPKKITNNCLEVCLRWNIYLSIVVINKHYQYFTNILIRIHIHKYQSKYSYSYLPFFVTPNIFAFLFAHIYKPKYICFIYSS